MTAQRKFRLLTVAATAALAVAGVLTTATAGSAATANTPCTAAKTYNAGTQWQYILPVSSAGSSNCYLVQGNTGNGVKAMQRAVMYCELIWIGDSQVDGSFGPDTKNGLKNFQRGKEITVDGQYGNQTRDTLYFYPGTSFPGIGNYYTCVNTAGKQQRTWI